MTIAELSPAQAYRACDPEQFPFQTTAELPLLPDVIGQPRATQAIEFGLDIAAPGYNIFVLDPTGTERITAVHHFLAPRAARHPTPDDWVYVYNFQRPRQPRAIRLPAGLGARLRYDMAALVVELRRAIPTAFEQESYRQASRRIDQERDAAQQELLAELEAQAQTRGCTIVPTPAGLTLAPMSGDQQLPPEFYQLPPEEQERLAAAHRGLTDRVDETLHRLRAHERAARAALRQLDRKVVAYAVDREIEELRADYSAEEEVDEYLLQVRADIVEHVDEFKQEPSPAAEREFDPFRRYQVNLLVDNGGQNGAPVILESNPTCANLIGRIEHEVHAGSTLTDFTMLRAGALHRANGGYLLLRARQLLADGRAWPALKRALLDGQLRIEDDYPALAVTSPNPEPIPLDVKVVLIGSPGLYAHLYHSDEELVELFKVRADLTADMERTPETEQLYARLIHTHCTEEGLRPLERTAVARVVEAGSRLADHQQRLSTCFGDVADLLREANYWAAVDGQSVVRRVDVQRAVAEQLYRTSLAEEQARREIIEGTTLIATCGGVVGQVNGLAISTSGGHRFGHPLRITASSYVGHHGVVNIQREVQLSGPTHGKGVLTLTSYLGGQYAVDRALTLCANISFEQTYDEVDGDSAALAELYALLSSLAGLPIRQGIAVTGSVDQHGRVQPIGAVNEKIEGFFRVCQASGLTGEQGAIIPAANCRNLMLHDDIVEALTARQFHVYPITTVDEGIECLTGVPAGERSAAGEFPPDSVHGRVVARLQALASSHDREDRPASEEPVAAERDPIA